MRVTYQVKLMENRRIPFAKLLLEKTSTGSKSMEAQYFHFLFILKPHLFLSELTRRRAGGSKRRKMANCNNHQLSCKGELLLPTTKLNA